MLNKKISVIINSMEGVNTEISNVPLEPPVNRHGFLLPAVMKEEYIFEHRRTRCIMCIDGCRLNRHHLYWPEFKKRIIRKLWLFGEKLFKFQIIEEMHCMGL